MRNFSIFAVQPLLCGNMDEPDHRIRCELHTMRGWAIFIEHRSIEQRSVHFVSRGQQFSQHGGGEGA